MGIEIEMMNSYFAQNSEGWCVGGFPSGYEQAKEIPLTVIESSLKAMELQGPYKSEAELRQALKGISLRTLFVGIYLLKATEGNIEVTKCFQSPGPDVGESSWKPIKIKH